MFVAYKDKMVLGKIKSIDGSEQHVVRDVVKRSAVKSQFDLALELFLSGTSDLLKLGMKQGNQFLLYILYQEHLKTRILLIKGGKK